MGLWKAFNSAVILLSQFSPELKPPERMSRNIRTDQMAENGNNGNWNYRFGISHFAVGG